MTRTLPRIAVIGTGRMGRAFGHALRRVGYCVRFGSARSGNETEDATDWATAVENADIVVLALLWESTARLPSVAGVLAGKVVLTCTNAETDGGLPVLAGESASETIAQALPASRVVAAFNHVYAELLEQRVSFEGGAPSVFLSGDDAAANADVEDIVRALGFDPVHTGPLNTAHFVEALAALMVNLVRRRGAAADSIALRLLRRTHDRLPVHHLE